MPEANEDPRTQSPEKPQAKIKMSIAIAVVFLCLLVAWGAPIAKSHKLEYEIEQCLLELDDADQQNEKAIRNVTSKLQALECSDRELIEVVKRTASSSRSKYLQCRKTRSINERVSQKTQHLPQQEKSAYRKAEFLFSWLAKRDNTYREHLAWLYLTHGDYIKGAAAFGQQIATIPESERTTKNADVYTKLVDGLTSCQIEIGRIDDARQLLEHVVPLCTGQEFNWLLDTKETGRVSYPKFQTQKSCLTRLAEIYAKKNDTSQELLIQRQLTSIVSKRLEQKEQELSELEDEQNGD